ncbi:putative transposase [Arsukibacterium tuosuense]|uniref:Putative transposase n=1 Tax=Arsukibacterium tuosuense TaxID=1323745 RepID=A0A285JP39_9GAMM|nr:transposase [Arsukibacterium tuosuense]SNY60831.1 putative transposase [Arsukibacterium tuosuense]
MARLPRVHLAGVPEHVIQRGNNRQVCFVNNEDFAAYVYWLKQYSAQFEVHIHAWVLMSNHVHLLCTASDNSGISLMMQSLGRKYVRYFNRRYLRTGTLWEGRYKSCLVQEEHYLLTLYRYIELNPVRAGMVASAADYKWSSYSINALGKHSDLCQPHACYLALADSVAERQQAYRDLFGKEVNEALLADIRSTIKSGMALGNARFKHEVAALTGRRQHRERPGRPKGSEQAD